ncbi:MAG: PKD domain-containing protein, partial [Sphingobacteriales bacterium]
QVRYANITTPGCLSDTITNTVVINPLPTAQITGDISVCQNAPQPNVTFTGIVGTAPFTFNYNINNGPNLVATTTTGNSVSIPVPTNTIGTYAYHLVSVRDAAGTAGCFQNQPDTVVINVNGLPTATISGSTSVCQNATSPSVIFTAAGGGSAPYTFTYKINNGADLFVTSTTGNSVTVPVPTTAAGTFTYSLVYVRDASTTTCGQAQTGSATVTVNALPTGTVSGTTEVCLNAAAPNVIFTGAAGTAPYTFSYTINAGAVQTITSTGNTASIAVPTNVAGSFAYQLLSVQDASSTICSQLQTGTATITVHPLPTGNFNVTSPGCVSRTVTFQDASVANVGAINSWSWNFGDPSSGANNTSILQNPTHIFSAPGTYNVSLIVTNDEGCSSILFSKPVIISALPVAGFISPEVCLLDPFALFTDTSGVDAPESITAWAWNFGDPGSGANNTSTIQNAQHTYSAVGNYNVQLIVTTANGCTDTLLQNLTVNGGNPQAAFVQLAPTTACSSDSISIQNKSTIGSGNITRVEIYWDNTAQPTVFETDDVPVFDKIYRHKYPTANITINYNVRFRAYSGGVCVSDRIQPVTALATPDVAIAAIPSQCFGSTPLPLTYGSQNGAIAGTENYSGPGVSFAGGWQFVPSVAGVGTHTIRYTFTATAGGCIDSAFTTVTVLDTASSRFTPVAPLCELNAVQFNDLSTAPAGVTLQNSVWDFGDGSAPQTVPAGQAVTHSFATEGNYTVSLYTISAAGCRSATFSQVVAIQPSPKANFNFADTLCLPAATASFRNLSTISNGTGGSMTYLWNFGDGSGTSTAFEPSHMYTAMGPYNVMLTVTSAAGCIGDTTIVLNSINPQPQSDFNISQPGGICIGDVVSFTDASNGANGTVDQWRWNFADGNLSQVQNPTHLYSQPNTYNVSLHIINSFGCLSDTTTKAFTVNPFPVVNAGADVFVLEGGSAVLSPVITAIQPQYLWEPGLYLSSTTVERPTTKPLADISYKLTVTGRGGCVASDDVFVKVLLGPKIPNTFSPNGDGINEKWLIDYLDTYPNNRVQVFTRAGQLVFQSRGYRTPWDGTMSGKSLPADTYYYIIEPENGRKPITGFVTILK